MARDFRMVDRTTAGVRFQVALGDVGPRVLPVDQNVIPGSVFGRLGPGLRMIPVVGAVKGRVDVDDDAPILKQPVMNQLANGKFRFTAQFVAYSRWTRPSSEHILLSHYMV